jgi:hypothetical protein
MYEGMEDRVVYREGSEVRCLRGLILEEGPTDFIRIQRRTGIIEIARSEIIKIERGQGCKGNERTDRTTKAYK